MKKTSSSKHPIGFYAAPSYHSFTPNTKDLPRPPHHLLCSERYQPTLFTNNHATPQSVFETPKSNNISSSAKIKAAVGIPLNSHSGHPAARIPLTENFAHCPIVPSRSQSALVVDEMSLQLKALLGIGRSA